MRLRKAEHHSITFALFTILIALISLQCFFVVGGVAEAEVEGYRELISDYFSFNAPTRIAACGEDFAVFDEGKVILFHNGAHTSFDVEITDCDKLLLSSDGVYLLTGVEEEQPAILSYDRSGAAKGYVLPAAYVSDICFNNGMVYTLAGTHVVGYDASNGNEAESFDLSRMSFSTHIAVDGGVSYFRKGDNKLIKRENDESTTIGVIGAVGSICAQGGKLYYVKDDEICVWGTSSPLLPKTNVSDDATFSFVTDFAVGDKIFVLDGKNYAVKVYSLSGEYRKMVGSYGKHLGRLNAPVAVTVKGEKVLVADSQRGSEFSATGVRPLNGRAVTAPTDVAMTGDAVYLADNGTLYEYNSSLVLSETHSYLSSSSCRYVTSSPKGKVYAASGRDVYVKKEGKSAFERAFSAEREINGMTVGIGGDVLYLLSGGTILAYADGEIIAEWSASYEVQGFAVDYRGNLYVVSGQKLYRYDRVPKGYLDTPTIYDLPTKYALYSDIALDESGDAYLIADHNVLIFPKAAFSIYSKADGSFEDTVASVDPRFVCEVVNDNAIAYVLPGNYEDITIIEKSTRLMCYAKVNYLGTDYIRAESEKGTVYLEASDVIEYQEGKAPFRKARCWLASFGENVVGVNIYQEPSKIKIRKGEAAIVAASLGKDDIFDVISIVAVDGEGRDVWGFYRVSYQGQEGYVLANEVVSPDDDPLPAPKTYEVQVKSDGLGKKVSVYREASKQSEVIATLSDGSKIKSLEPINKNNEFTKVLYNGEECYILTANLGEKGLTAGQVLAIVLTVVAAVGSVLTILILRANKKHKRNQKE